MPLQLVAPRRLYRQIADQIAGLIAAGEFPPASRLPAERELAAKLGVSRASVREAIISLEIGGLVEVRVGTGIFVTTRHHSTTAGIDGGSDGGPGPFDLLSARKIVEGEIAALAASGASAADIDALRSSVDRMTTHVDDFAVREDSDRDFHLRLAKATGNGSLELVVEGLWNQRAELWGRMQQHFHTSDLAQQTIRDHAAIVRAVAAHDPARARAAMHKHLARVTREFQRGLDDAARGDGRSEGRSEANRRPRIANGKKSTRAA